MGASQTPENSPAKAELKQAVLPAPLPADPVKAAALPPPAPQSAAAADFAASGADSSQKIKEHAKQLAADRTEMRELIGKIKANGFGEMLFVTRGVSAPESSVNSAMKLFRDSEIPWSVYNTSNPTEHLRQHGSVYAIASKDVMVPGSEDKIRIPPFQLTATQVPGSADGIVRVQVTDYLTPGRPFVLDKTVDLNDPKNREAVCEELVKVFRTRQHDGSYRRTLEHAEPDKHYQPAVTSAKTPLYSAGGLQELGRDFEKLGFVVLPRGSAHEKSYEDVGITPSRLENGVAINGEVKSVVAYHDIKLKEGRYTLDKEGLLLGINGHPAPHAYKDKFGNQIELSYSLVRNPQVGDSVREIIEVTPPHNLSKNGEKMSKLSVDLSPLGYSSEMDLAVCRTLDKVGSNGGIEFYTDMDSKRVAKEYKKQLPLIADGARDIEKLFKLQPLEDIKTVVVLDSERPNAHFSKLNPNTLVILDERLRGNGQEIVGRHEAAHLVDGKYDGKLSAGLAAIHRRLSSDNPEFFTKLNESSFSPRIGSGGHSQANPAEMFASLINSVAAPDCEKQLQRLGPRFCADYAESLRALRKQFEATPGFPQDAPIVGLIDKRLASPALSSSKASDH